MGLEKELGPGQQTCMVWWGHCIPLLVLALSQPSLFTTHHLAAEGTVLEQECLGAVTCSVVLITGPFRIE